jgi:hypothetical protein
MAVATKDRDLQEIAPGRARGLGLATNLTIFAGTIACISTATGFLTKGATATTLRAVGVFKRAHSSVGQADGVVMAEPEIGVFGPFANSAAGDQITNADIGATCFIVDDQTVAKTNGTNTRSAAGRVWQVTAEGVWIDFRV